MNDSPTSRLDGSRILVTGATRRLGRAIALRLAARGARLCLHYRSDEAGRAETELALDARGHATEDRTWIRADLGAADACDLVATTALETWHGLDGLVNNAAMFRRTPLTEMTLGDFDEQVRVNARSVYALSLAIGKRMVAEGGGAIVNIADVSATRPWGTHVPYCASKAAVLNLTRGFARALAPAVRVNAVSPGAALPPEDAAQSTNPPPALIAGHSGAEAIAAAVELCLTAGYLTGVDLQVDGGRSLM